MSVPSRTVLKVETVNLHQLMLRKASLIRSKSLSSIMNGYPFKKRFKWSLETRLLLIEAVTMVDGDQASKLQTIEKVMQMLCGTTPEAAAAAVVTIPITQQERWQDVGSRLQSIFDDSIAEARRWSICLSQFVKLQRCLKLMKPHADHSYRRANGKRDRIMTSKLCHMLIKYHSAFRLNGEKEGSGQRLTLRSDQNRYNGGHIRLGNDKRSRAEHILVSKDQQDGGEDFPLTFDKQKALARKGLRGECFPSRDEKVCGRKLKLRLCHKQKGPGKLFRLGKVEHVPIKSTEKNPPESLSTYSLNVCPPHDVSSEHCSKETTPQGIFPSNKDEQLLGEQGPLSNSWEGRPEHSHLSNDEKGNRKLVPFGSEHEGGGMVDYSLGNDEKTGSFASLDKSLSHKSKGCPIKTYFKWSLETRLLLIEAVAMVDGDHATKLRTVEKAMRMLCGATAVAAAAAVATIPYSQQERWQNVASRLPSIFDDSIHQDKRWSICRSQFEKLKQNLKFMKPQGGNSYRKANGKRDPIMTSKLCSKLTECDAAFCLSENPTGPGQQRLSLKRDQKGGEEDIPLSSKKRKRIGKKMRLSNDQKESGERFPMSKERKVCGRKHNLRLCHRQKGPGKILSLVKVKKHRVEHVPIKGSEKSAPQGISTNCSKVSPPDDRVCSYQCSKKFTSRGVCPLSKLRGPQQVLLSNDREGRRQVASPPRCDERSIGDQVSLSNSHEGRGVDPPLSNDEKCNSTAEIPFSDDQKDQGVDSPLSKSREGRGVDSPLLNDENCSLEDVAIMGNDKKCHGIECASFSKDGRSNGKDVALNINKTGQAEDTPSNNEKELSNDSPQLVASRDEEDSLYGHPLQGQKYRQLCGKEVPEDRLVEMTDYSRGNVFRWSEESRLQVIKGVMKMESCQLSKMGHKKSWREVAKCLPQKLFWDVDVDRLAIIAMKQFAEMRRRYLILKENESTGEVANLKFNTMTQDIIREMELYEESLVWRPPPAGLTRELCIVKDQKGRWLTKKPRLLRTPKAQRGHGAIVVEIFISPPGCVQDNSSHGFHPEFDSYDDLTRLGEQSMLPYHMEPSDYENRDGFEKLHTHRQYHESGSDYRRSIHMHSATASSYSEEKFNHSEKGYGENFEDREHYLDLQGRRTMSSPNSKGNWHSEPYYARNVIEESPYRQKGSSSFISRRDHGLDENYSFENQQRVLCDSQRRINSGESEYPGWDSTGSQREDLDSASADGRSKSLEDSEAVAHHLWNANSESKDFLQSDSGEPFQDSTREYSVKRKSSSSADSQWDERDELDRQNSPTNEHHGDYDIASPYRKKARSTKLYSKNCAAIPSGSPTDFSEAEHDAVADDAPILDQILAKVDLEFSRLNWWVNHQLFPTGREKITSCIKSASTSAALDKRLESVGAFDQAVISKCRQKQILWVLKAELQQVRLRLVDEIEKSSQVVVQEVLQSFKI